MQIGLIDVDGHNFPNIPLMKLSAWHKQNGDSVEWYDPMFSGHMDKVYMSKVFSDAYTPDYPYCVDADEIIKGGTGYCITTVNGREVYDKSKDIVLPEEVEHIYPDYSIYPELTGYGKPLKQQTCYGFLSRGCPRGCDFCHVKEKEGRCAYKVADLSEFWCGQGNIVLCDPNIIACKEWKELLQQLIDSKAYVDINQGIDIRMMTEEKAEMIKQIRLRNVHFAWDRYEDKDIVVPKFKQFKDITGFGRHKITVYMLTNFDTTIEQDYERIYILREMQMKPYMMIYNKPSLPRGHELLAMQQWVNNASVFWGCESVEAYKNAKKQCYLRSKNKRG